MYDKKKIDLSLCSLLPCTKWLMTVEQSKHIEHVADWPLVQERWRKRLQWPSWQTNLDCARSTADALRQLKGPFFVRYSLESKRMPIPRAESIQCQALFYDTGLFRLAVSKKVGAFACGYHNLGYLLDCMLLACLLYDCRLDRCLATRLTDYLQTAASVVSFAYLRPRPVDC